MLHRNKNQKFQNKTEHAIEEETNIIHIARKDFKRKA